MRPHRPPRGLRRATLLLALVAATFGWGPPAQAQVAAPAVCPGTFQVLHDDRIGLLTLTAGHYTITVADPAALSCADAATWLSRFLQDYDGVLPRPWIYDLGTSSFTAGDGRAFTATRASTPSGGGGVHPSGGVTRCPATFQVLHDDRIGQLRLPAGPYTITPASSQISCATASARFTAFLNDFDGRLPRPWTLNAQTGTFTRSPGVGFRVKLAPAPSGGGGGGVAALGRRCGGEPFSIDFPNRLGGLRIPAGAYRVYVYGRLRCVPAEAAFGRLLNLRRLPGAWAVDAATATFSRAGVVRFRIELLS